MFETDSVLRYLADCTAVELRHLLPSDEDHVGRMNRWTGRYSRVSAPSTSDDVGLLAGRLWLLHLATDDAELSAWATRIVESIAAATGSGLERVDGGFAMHLGLCWGADVTGTQRWRDLAFEAARTYVAKAWSPQARAFVSRYPDECLIAMEGAAFRTYLGWSEDPAVFEAYTGHLDRLLELGFVRPDGSCFQIAELDDEHQLVGMASHQGYATESTWARGQAWGLLGYIAGFEATDDERYLDTVRRMADWWVARTTDDPVPFYDFDDPRGADLPRDSCAAAIVASVLIRLERARPGAGYLEVADRTLAELHANYLGRGGAMLHGSLGNIKRPVLFGQTYTRRPPSSEAEWASCHRFPQEEVMQYGDFFFVDALCRRAHDDWPLFARPPRGRG